MAVKVGIIFCAFLVGSLAVPVKQNETELPSIFFDNAGPATPGARIVGGDVAAVGSHPWMAALTHGMLFRSYLCGGSILSKRTVLTAAHCIAAVHSPLTGLSTTLRVTVGTNRWNEGGQRIRVHSFAMHKQFDSDSISNDLGMLYTSHNIIFNDLVKPISLDYEYVDCGVETRAAGWGRTTTTGLFSNNLVEVHLPTIAGLVCEATAEQAAVDLETIAPAVDSETQLCTYHSRGVGTCRGDGGGALVRVDRNTQVGIVSWGFPCARGAPDVYVRISAFKDWIKENTRETMT